MITIEAGVKVPILFKQSTLAELDSILEELVTSSMVGIDEELPFKSHTVFQKV